MNKKTVNALRASALIFLAAALCNATTRPTYAADCVPVRATGPVAAVYKAPENASVFASVPQQNRSRAVVLGNRIVVEVQELAKFITEAKCRNKGMVVVLNGRPVKGLALFGPVSETSNLLYFDLKRTSDARPVWSEILGSPDFTPRKVAVTLGIEGEVPLPAKDTELDLDVLPDRWAFAALAGFLALFATFLVLAKLTNILRDGSPPEDAVAVVKGRLDPRRSVTNNGTYSLAKLQGAWWFFIILAAYLLIGTVTWDFFHSISSTAVILLGIGAGTVIGAAVIDTSKNTPEQKDAQEKKAAELKVRIEQLEDAEEFALLEANRLGSTPLTAPEAAKHAALVARYGPDMPKWLRESVGRPFLTVADRFELAALVAAAPAPGTPQAARLGELQAKYPSATVAQLPDLLPKASDIAAERELAISRYRKLTNQSEWWFVDILSDANGVSFHRFQLFGWTVVLGVVFAVAAYRDLAMPIFDTTLMGLLGLSAGTYLGLKIPEPTVPKG